MYGCDGGLLDSEAGGACLGYSGEKVLLCGELESFDGEADCHLVFKEEYVGDLRYELMRSIVYITKERCCSQDFPRDDKYT